MQDLHVQETQKISPVRELWIKVKACSPCPQWRWRCRACSRRLSRDRSTGWQWPGCRSPPPAACPSCHTWGSAKAQGMLPPRQTAKRIRSANRLNNKVALDKWAMKFASEIQSPCLIIKIVLKVALNRAPDAGIKQPKRTNNIKEFCEFAIFCHGIVEKNQFSTTGNWFLFDSESHIFWESTQRYKLTCMTKQTKRNRDESRRSARAVWPWAFPFGRGATAPNWRPITTFSLTVLMKRGLLGTEVKNLCFS